MIFVILLAGLRLKSGTPLPAVGSGAPVRSIEKTTSRTTFIAIFNDASSLPTFATTEPTCVGYFLIIPVPVFRVETKKYCIYDISYAQLGAILAIYTGLPRHSASESVWRGHWHGTMTSKSLMPTAPSCIDNRWRSTTLLAADSATSGWEWAPMSIGKNQIIGSLPQIFSDVFFSIKVSFFCK